MNGKAWLIVASLCAVSGGLGMECFKESAARVKKIAKHDFKILQSYKSHSLMNPSVKSNEHFIQPDLL